MRSIDSWFDRFCRKHPRLAIPNLMMYIVIGTAIVYILDMFGPFPISDYLTFSPYYIVRGQVWRLITFIFIPLDNNPFWFILSLYMYWWIGSAVEREWGSTKFTVFYGTGVLLNILSGLILALFLGGFSGPIPTLHGAEYLNMSLFFSMATLFPDLTILLFFVIPLKAKWLAWIDAALFLFGIGILLSAGSLRLKESLPAASRNNSSASVHRIFPMDRLLLTKNGLKLRSAGIIVWAKRVWEKTARL